MTLSRRAAQVIVSVYPLAWRRRYAEEMLALLEQRPPGLRDVLNLLSGAAAAHVRPVRGLAEAVAPAEQMRSTVTSVAMCFGVVVLAGAGFAKETEDPIFQLSANAHPLLGLLRDSVTVIAIASALTVAVAGAPLLWWVLRRAWRERRRDLLWRLALAPAAVVLFAALTAALLAGLNSRSAGAPVSAATPLVALAWQALGLVTGLACAYAPRLVLLRVSAPESLLRRGVVACRVLLACMSGLALTTAAYGVELLVRAPSVAAQSGGPLWPTTGAAVLFAAAAMACAVAPAALSCRRGRRALARR